MKAWILNVDGSVNNLKPFDDPAAYVAGARTGLAKSDLLRLMKHLRIEDGGMLERVAVLFNDKRCDMIVDESGALKGLPINARASLIYWTATCRGRTGASFDPLAGPLIHGRAVLYDGVVWD